MCDFRKDLRKLLKFEKQGNINILVGCPDARCIKPRIIGMQLAWFYNQWHAFLYSLSLSLIPTLSPLFPSPSIICPRFNPTILDIHSHLPSHSPSPKEHILSTWTIPESTFLSPQNSPLALTSLPRKVVRWHTLYQNHNC